MFIKGKVGNEELFNSLLNALSVSNKTGTLVVKGGDVERRLFFEDGAIVSASSTAREESFGRLLVELAIIHEETIEKAEGFKDGASALFGRKLVDLGVMTECEVERAVRLKVKKTISDIISRPDATFTFVNERLPDKRRIPVAIHVHEMVSGGKKEGAEDRPQAAEDHTAKEEQTAAVEERTEKYEVVEDSAQESESADEQAEELGVVEGTAEELDVAEDRVEKYEERTEKDEVVADEGEESEAVDEPIDEFDVDEETVEEPEVAAEWTETHEVVADEGKESEAVEELIDEFDVDEDAAAEPEVAAERTETHEVVADDAGEESKALDEPTEELDVDKDTAEEVAAERTTHEAVEDETRGFGVVDVRPDEDEVAEARRQKFEAIGERLRKAEVIEDGKGDDGVAEYETGKVGAAEEGVQESVVTEETIKEYEFVEGQKAEPEEPRSERSISEVREHDPSEDRLLEVLDGFRGKYSASMATPSPDPITSRKPTPETVVETTPELGPAPTPIPERVLEPPPTPEPIPTPEPAPMPRPKPMLEPSPAPKGPPPSREEKVRPIYDPAEVKEISSKTLLIAAGVLLAIVSAGFWLFSGNGDKQASEDRNYRETTGADANVDVPPDGAPSGETHGEAVSAEDTSPPEPQQGRPVSPKSVGTSKTARPDAPQRAETAPAESKRPASRDEPVERRETAPSPPPPAPPPKAEPSPDIARELVREEPAVEESSAEPAQPEPSVETAPAQRSGTSEGGSGNTSPPVSEAKAAQPEASGWNSAIFAPKPAIVKSKPSESAVQPGALVEPGPDVIDPVLIEHPELKYPNEAKRRKVEAVVRVRVLVDENGSVLEAKVEKPVGHGLDEAATEVALKAKFIPATKNTVAVKMWTVLPLRYSLQK